VSKVLVTGAAGFIGSHVCDALIANGHRVIGMDNLSGGVVENVPAACEFWQRDFTCPKQVELVFSECRPDIVIHAGAYAAEILSPHIRRFNYENNLLGSINLINAAVNHRCKGFVFLSSIATYGHQKPPFYEMTPLAPADPYGVAKMAVELDLKAAHAMFGLPYIIFRPFNVYGPRQNIGDAYRNVIGIFMNQCLKREPMTIFGDGSQTRAFSYISDVAPVIATSIDRPECWGLTFNIGGTRAMRVDVLSELVWYALGNKGPYQRHKLEARKEARHAFCDTTKARIFFKGLMPDVSLEDGLPLMAEWVLKHGSRSTSKFANIEIEEGLPEIWKVTA
jgi:UDP-glucose 4-epimerase